MPIRLAEVKLGSYEATVVANSRYLFVIQYFMLLQVFFLLLTCFEFIYRPVGRGMRRVAWGGRPPPPPPPHHRLWRSTFFLNNDLRDLKQLITYYLIAKLL